MRLEWRPSKWLNPNSEMLFEVITDSSFRVEVRFKATWYHVIRKRDRVDVLYDDGKRLSFPTITEAKGYCEVCYRMGVKHES